MGATATRNVRIKFTGDATGLGRAADDGEKHISRWQRGVANVAKAAAVGAVAIGAAFVAMAKSSVSAFVESEAAQAKLADAYSRFPKLANLNIEALRGFNSELAKKVRFDDDALASGQAVLAQFNLSGTQLRDITPLLADYAAKTGRDLPTAAQVLGKSFLGNTKALKELGISYKSTGDQAKDVANITEILRKQVGGFAEKEGQTAAGRAEILKNQFGEVQEKIGAKLLPALMALSTWILEVGIPAIERLVDWFQTHLGPVIVKVFSWIKQNVFPIVEGFGRILRETLLPAISDLFRFIKDNWTTIRDLAIIIGAMFVPAMLLAGAMKVYQGALLLATGAQWLLNAAMSANPIFLLIALVAGLVAAFIILWNKSAAFRDFFIGAWEKIKLAVGAVVDWVKDKWNDLIGFFQGIPGFFSRIGERIADGIKSGFKSAINFLIDMINRLVSGTNKLIGGLNAVNPFGSIPPIPHIPRVARGGLLTRGGLAMVGERGREIVSLPTGAQVHSNRDTEAMVGGGVTEVRVFIGDQELKGIVRTEISETNRSTRRSVLAGAGGAR